MTESQKLGVGTRSILPSSHHSSCPFKRGLREISPIYDLMCLLFFGIKRGKSESWPKIKVGSPVYTILQINAVITTYHRAMCSIFLIIS